ncbi:biotin carboxylase N-terminal domain-containing protein [Mycobacterium intracellulare]|uniref:biotin carboxylase n=1 Tax=Mycobacterium intracellulare subsp. chimaera TaxID=222805 RepID=A0A7U5MPX3_MYCIT|nr:biotin carboxylase N-terminal domain-containing protein [Mycobacterium intracellulare]ASL17555.1 acetyl-/propionyl-coenzyme A carboxylase subunit alpha AccA1 [Mycobacterium intracellulare subsp. chimaera]MDM3929490.1 biotin carboxylase N-terminal domain-containing protein [Mycobacterium intracellulare subsp. chimaera]
MTIRKPQLSTLLIANRGEIARRIIRTAKSMGIVPVAVYAESDAHAPFVREAIRAVPLQGTTSAETYLDIEKLLAAAQRVEADAVHPGYGFLAENAALARACEKAGILFIGPSADNIEAMANKIAAKQIAERAGVPVLPTGELAGPDDPLMERRANSVGYPLLVKAVAGGGGKGMRQVTRREDLASACASAAREAEAAFGDGSLFLEHYVAGGRHVEVQILADSHGGVFHLLDRDCSIQRRHQKVIEEAPAVDIGREVRDRLHDSAVALARSIGYLGAGTVEFLVDGDNAYFLEMNTRLQVEHPVTEEVLGLDIVRYQLEIARGEALPAQLRDIAAVSHAVEARVCAEQPGNHWLPSIGRITAYREPQGDGIRIESAVGAGDEITPNFDSMIAKVIAHGKDRPEAFARLSGALQGLVIDGIETNIELLKAICRNEEILQTPQPTTWLEQRADLMSVAPPDHISEAHSVLAALAYAVRVKRASGLLAEVPVGWRNVYGVGQASRWSCGSNEYSIEATAVDRERNQVTVDNRLVDIRVRAIGDSSVDAEIDGLRYQTEMLWNGDEVRAVGHEWQTRHRRVAPRGSGAGQSASGSCVAALPGTVVRVDVTPGAQVVAGDSLCVLESMKMEHVIRAPADGVITKVNVAIGASVSVGQSLFVVQEDE